jgi:hypothetical protein
MDYVYLLRRLAPEVAQITMNILIIDFVGNRS